MTNRHRGILSILFSAFGFALMSLFISLAGNLPTMQKMFFRNLVAATIAIIVFYRDMKSHQKSFKDYTQTLSWPLMILRCFLGTAGIFLNFYTVDHLLLADASVLNKLAPFATLIFSAIFLHERMDLWHILALALAFFGVLLVSQPGEHIQSFFPYLTGVLGGICAGGAYTCVRQLNKLGVRPSLIVLCFSLFSCLLCIPYLIFNYHPMTLHAFLALIGVGLAAAMGQFGITLAYQYAPANEISIFDYTSILFSGLLGFIFLSQKPNLSSFAGYALIFLGGLLTFLYNRKQSRRILNSGSLEP